MVDRTWSRRSVLKTAAGGISTGGLVFSSSSVGATDSSTATSDRLKDANARKVRDFYSEVYPSVEVDYLVERWKHYRSLVLNNGLTRGEAFAELTREIQDNTDQLSQDVNVSERFNQSRNQLRKDSQSADEFIAISSSDGISTSSIGCGGQYSVSSAFYENTDTGGTAVTSARTLGDTEIEANSTSYGYANGFAWAERGGAYFSEQDGKVNISVEYDRSGVEDTADGGKCEIILFLQDVQTNATESYVLESGDTSGATVCKGVTSSLAQKDRGIKVILQISTEVRGFGGDVYADYYAGTRGVSIKNMYATPV